MKKVLGIFFIIIGTLLGLNWLNLMLKLLLKILKNEIPSASYFLGYSIPQIFVLLIIIFLLILGINFISGSKKDTPTKERKT